MQNLNYLYVVFVTSPFKESKHCPGCGLVCFISDPNPGFSKVGSESVFLRLDPDPFFCRSDQDPFFSKVGSGPGIFLKVGSGSGFFKGRIRIHFFSKVGTESGFFAKVGSGTKKSPPGSASLQCKSAAWKAKHRFRQSAGPELRKTLYSVDLTSWEDLNSVFIRPACFSPFR